VRKSGFTQIIGKGYAPDIHTANGAPREAFVKFTKAEDGGIGGKGRWDPAEKGYRPTYEDEKVRKYLSGDYVEVEGG
jgi:nitrate reductase alpha subunit